MASCGSSGLCQSYRKKHGKIKSLLAYLMGSPGSSYGKGSACNAEDLGSIPGLGQSTGGGHSNPPQYSCLENPKDRGAWWATVHGVTESHT